jgi:hypothetical protein
VSDSALSKERKFVLLKKEKQSLKDRKKKIKIPSITKGVEERAIYFWPGAVARELSVNFREVEPLFTVHQPWTLELEPALERVLVPVPE